MVKRIIAMASVLAAVVLSTGCASVQMASAEKDAAAKTFAVKHDKANIYVYRNETMGAAVKMPVALNGKLVGDTAAKTFMKLEVPAGEHTLLSKTENDSVLAVKADAGKNYFVWQEVKMGVFAPRSLLQLVDEKAGKSAIEECKLVQETY
jgi:PBP1b-binding outer membrane lipoprotein LpoB